MTVEARKIRLIMELRRQGISDTRVLAAIERTPREAFVPEVFLDQAYDNQALPIGYGQTVSQPQVVAMMTEVLEVDRRMRVLEIGTGSGYQAAVLSRLCRRVYSIERSRTLLRQAEARFASLRLHNITCHWGDGSGGWPLQAPLQRIIVTAAAAEIPDALVDQLAPGGILVIPVGERGEVQSLLRVVRDPKKLRIEALGPVRFVPLVGAPPADKEVAAAEPWPLQAATPKSGTMS